MVWHKAMGINLATAGSFISSISTDDPTYNIFSLPSGRGDNDQFTITNGNELHVGSNAIASTGVYELNLSISNGTNAVQHAFTVTMVPNNCLPLIHCGTSFCVVRTNTGAIWAWGDNAAGQLGQGDNTQRSSPTIVARANFESQEIVDIQCGAQSILYLTREGDVFGVGTNNGGQLGLGNNSAVYTPTKITTNIGSKRVVRVRKTIWAAQFLTDEGEVYSCGKSGSYHGLGFDPDTYDPTVIPSPEVGATSGPLLNKHVIALGGGYSHTFMLTTEGELFCFGRDSNGALGLGGLGLGTFVRSPVLNTQAPSADRVATTHTETGNIRTSAGLVYASGENANGELGLGTGGGFDSSDRSQFALLPASSYDNKTIVQFSGGVSRSPSFNE